MKKERFNSADIIFLGAFKYDLEYFDSQNKNATYVGHDYFTKNKEYLAQKYYTNWLDSLFTTIHFGKGKAKTSQLNNYCFDFDKTEIATDFEHEFATQNNISRKVKYSINGIEVFLFNENLGVFLIRTSLSNKSIPLEDIISFSRNFRGIGQGELTNSGNVLVEIIEHNIIPYFHPESDNWRAYNPQLKTAIFADVQSIPNTEVMNELLYSLATFTSPDANSIFTPNKSYYNDLIETNKISIFDNWSAMCLFDSLVRVSVNLEGIDKYKTWQNEYLLIYIYVLSARYYLYHINTQLSEIHTSLKTSMLLKEKFMTFMNSFEHKKISYKYLPNVLFEKFKLVFEVEEEIRLIENKISRINSHQREKSDRNINRILLLLTLLTVISVANDSGQLASQFVNTNSSQIVHLVTSFLILIICILVVIKLKRNK